MMLQVNAKALNIITYIFFSTATFSPFFEAQTNVIPLSHGSPSVTSKP